MNRPDNKLLLYSNSTLTLHQRCNLVTLHLFNWKHDAIAAHFGIAQSTVGRIIRGMGYPTKADLRQMEMAA